MSAQKKKHTSLKYNQIMTFIADMSPEATVARLDASERDLPQLDSRIEDTDIDAQTTMLRLHYGKAATLFVRVKTWARGTQSQVTIYRGEAIQPRIKAPQQENPGCLLIQIPVYTVIGIFIISTLMTAFNLSDAVIDWLVLLAPVFIVLGVIIRSIRESVHEENAKKNKRIRRKPPQDTPLIADRRVETNPIYEALLVNYVKRVLDAPAQDDSLALLLEAENEMQRSAPAFKSPLRKRG